MARATVAMALLLGMPAGSAGHGYLAFPPMRGGTNGSDLNNYCAQCGNGASVCGDGGQWGPSDMLGYAEGPRTVLVAGGEVEFEILVTAHHMGHFEFGICEERITHSTADAQACVDMHKLKRAPPPDDCVPNDDRGDCQPLLEQQQERWYLPPGTGTYKMRFLLPADLDCQECTLQWRWWTANSCAPAVDYGCFFDLMRERGWDADNWCGAFCGTCTQSLLQTSQSSLRTAQGVGNGCGEEFRNCADVTISSSDSSGSVPVAAPVVAAPTTAPSQAPLPAEAAAPEAGEAPVGGCVRNMDCSVNAWCGQTSFDSWCPTHDAVGECPSPQCTQTTGLPATASTAAPTVAPIATPTSPPAATPTSPPAATPGAGAPQGTCVSQNALACINDYSTYWPKCSPGQSKDNIGPSGYEFGQYCSQAWADALNEVLADPVVDKCGDAEAIQKFLAQVAYETGYYSTVYQPLDGGAGLIHMIPGNWQPNAQDMDALWPGRDYASTAESMGKDFFQTPAYGWRSVAAWFKLTNGVIGGCGADLFDEAYEEQTRCILSRVVDRQEAFDVVGRCLEAHPPPTQPSPPSLPASATQAPVVPLPVTPTAAPAQAGSTQPPAAPVAPPCVPIGDCGALPWCDQDQFVAFCAETSEGVCHPVFCKQEAAAELVPQPDAEVALQKPQAAPRRAPASRHTFLGAVLVQERAALARGRSEL